MKDKTLILDYSKWRCGSYGKYRHGKGETLLLNDEGYMCCLGQFSLQLNKELKNNDIRGLDSPKKVNKEIPLLSKTSSSLKENSALTIGAIYINDSGEITNPTKVRALRKLFGEAGYKIKVINGPKNIPSE